MQEFNWCVSNKMCHCVHTHTHSLTGRGRESVMVQKQLLKCYDMDNKNGRKGINRGSGKEKQGSLLKGKH